MDMTLNEVKVCLGTLGSILVMINEMESPTIKKVRKAIENEMELIESQIKKVN